MISCMRYIVIIYNFLFWLLGVAILATTIFLYVDSQNYVDFENTSELYVTPFLIMMVLGAVMTLVGFLGCCGAIRESTCVLGSYFLFCITMCVACGAAVWWSVENAELVRHRLQSDIHNVVRLKYGRGASGATEAIVDKIQQDFECCGVKGISDWATSNYNSNVKNQTLPLDYGVGGVSGRPTSTFFKVPSSCCIHGQSNCEKIRNEVQLNQPSPGIYRNGCWEHVEKYFEEQWKWLIIVAGALIGVQSLALLFACCLCCAITRGDDK